MSALIDIVLGDTVALWRCLFLSCFHPNGVLFSDGKAGKFIGPLSTEKVNAFESNGWEVVPVPCGKCRGCRLDKSKYWADRMFLEFATEREDYPSKTALFLTLTYDEEHVPWVTCTDGVQRHNLDPSHCQLFLKRIRKFFWSRFHRRLRFYLCGEYGSHTFRPHYHMILFGASLADFPDSFVYSSTSESGGILYESKRLDDLWSYGACRFAVANYQTFCYVGRYVLKKQYDSDPSSSDFSYRGRTPVFQRCSLRPGLGADYFSEFDGSKVFLSDGIDVHRIGIPRNVLEKLRLTNPELYDTIKAQRREIARGYQALVSDTVDCDYFDYLRHQELSFAQKTKSLKRKDV